ncbi:hypothetical protein D8Z77_20825 [Brevibacillus laterosporus]|nr:hypothetical protein D8Z77_20825 [Brevibacillus laterosporus]
MVGKLTRTSSLFELQLLKQPIYLLSPYMYKFTIRFFYSIRLYSLKTFYNFRLISTKTLKKRKNTHMDALSKIIINDPDHLGIQRLPSHILYLVFLQMIMKHKIEMKVN